MTPIDTPVDKLTRSIEEAATGRSIDTVVSRASAADLTSLGPGWRFDWAAESGRAEVYKLTAEGYGPTIQGLVSIGRASGYLEVHLLESHPDSVGKGKRYLGIPGNLFAFAAKLSVDSGHDGWLAFEAKTALISHYEKTIGARRVGTSQRMIVDAVAARRLIDAYFGDKP